MKITITFDTGDAACQDNLRGEVERIIGTVSKGVLEAIEADEHAAEDYGSIRDSNGNRIGGWILEP